MSGKTAFIYHPGYENRGLSPFPAVWQRYKFTYDRCQELGLFEHGVEVRQQEPATEADLRLVHTQQYVDYVKIADKAGGGYLDHGDTPAYPGVFRRASLSVGGTLLAAKLIATGEFTHAFNPGGGLHHARAERAGGFCVFNDIVIAVRYLQREFGLERLAIVDIDGHHSDGTQVLLYSEPILKISLHHYGSWFYPGTGAINEIGEGPGTGYMVNVPLPARVPDSAYLFAFREVVVPLLKSYQPQIILFQCGVDAHHLDPLVGLGLTTHGFAEIANIMHNIALWLCEGRLLILGGGGYDPKVVARCWAITLATVSGAVQPEFAERLAALHDPAPSSGPKELENEIRRVVAAVKDTLFPLHHIPIG